MHACMLTYLCMWWIDSGMDFMYMHAYIHTGMLSTPFSASRRARHTHTHTHTHIHTYVHVCTHSGVTERAVEALRRLAREGSISKEHKRRLLTDIVSHHKVRVYMHACAHVCVCVCVCILLTDIVSHHNVRVYARMCACVVCVCILLMKCCKSS